MEATRPSHAVTGADLAKEAASELDGCMDLLSGLTDEEKFAGGLNSPAGE